MGSYSLAPKEFAEILTPTSCTYASANTKGTWVQVVASTAFTYKALRVNDVQPNNDGGGDCFLTDIGVGAAGSEQVVIPNILLDSYRSAQGTQSLDFSVPINIPSGSRIAVRCQSAGGAGTRNSRVFLVGCNGGSNYPPASDGAVTNYGAATASTNGVLIDQGSVANTWGAWTQMTASASADHNWVILLIGNNKQTGATGQNDIYRFQLGVGAAAAEQTLTEWQCGSKYETGIFHSFDARYINIPSGSRLSLRCQSTSGATAQRNATAVLLCG